MGRGRGDRSPRVNPGRKQCGHVPPRPPPHRRCKRLLHRRTRRARVGPSGAGGRAAAADCDSDESREAVSHRRLSGDAGPSALYADSAGRGCGLLHAVAVDQGQVLGRFAGIGAAITEQGGEIRERHMAAAVLGAPYPGRGGLRRACPVLLVEPGETWVCREADRLAVFVDPPRHPYGAGRSGVSSVGWVVPPKAGSPTMVVRRVAGTGWVIPRVPCGTTHPTLAACLCPTGRSHGKSNECRASLAAYLH